MEVQGLINATGLVHARVKLRATARYHKQEQVIWLLSLCCKRSIVLSIFVRTLCLSMLLSSFHKFLSVEKQAQSATKQTILIDATLSKWTLRPFTDQKVMLVAQLSAF